MVFQEQFNCKVYPPVSEASREVANLTLRKNPHTPVNGVKEFFCLQIGDSTVAQSTFPKLPGMQVEESQKWSVHVNKQLFGPSVEYSVLRPSIYLVL